MDEEYQKLNRSESEENNDLLDSDCKNEEESSLDEIINSIGRGTWTYIYFMITCTFTAVETVNLFGPVFQVPNLDFKCNETLHNNEDVMPLNGSHCQILRRKLSNNSIFEESPCRSFVYDESIYGSTLTEEFNLVCSKSDLREFYKSAYLVGCVLGSLIGGILPDKFGRKPVLWHSSLLMTTLTFLLVIVPIFELVLVLRLLMGITTMAVSISAYTIAIESSPVSLRSAFTIAGALPYGMMVSVLALIAYLTKNWRGTQLWSSIPLYLLLALSNPYLLEESPRWLIEKGKLKEAEKVIRIAAKMNGKTNQLPGKLTEALFNIHMETNSARLKASTMEADNELKRLKSLVSTWPMFKLTVITCTIWFCQGCIYIVIPYRGNAFQSPFMYIGLLGLSECPAYILILPLVLRLERKTSLCFSFTLVAAIMITIVTLEVSAIQIEWLNIVISAVGYTIISTIYMVDLLYCSELYPTSVRSTGLSTAMFFGNIGFNLPVLLNIIIPSSLSWLSLAIISFLALVSAISVCFLPETKDRALLQTVDEYVTANGGKEREIAFVSP